MKMPNLVQSLHEKALDAARKFFRAEAELLDILQKIDACKAFRELGHTSLFSYAVNELKLSESVALNFINVARKSIQVPELKKEIEQGNLSVSKARKIVPVLNAQNKSEWIEKAKVLPTQKLEREVARIAPREASQERVKYVSSERMHLSLDLDEQTMQMIKRIQDIESSKKQRAVSLEETLTAMANLYIEKLDPIEKAKRAEQKKTGVKTSYVSTTYKTGRKPIPAELDHAVMLRDGGQCTKIDVKGKRCEQKRWLHIHHIKPVSHGGTNTLENLTLLCTVHHRMEHAQADLRLRSFYCPTSSHLTKTFTAA